MFFTSIARVGRYKPTVTDSDQTRGTERAGAQRGDRVLRAITDDGAFRVMVTRTTNTVTEAVRLQEARGETARRFGNLLTASVLFRETMAPQLRVQGILRGEGNSGTLVADSTPDGTRGLVQLKAESSEILVGPKALLQMMRTMPNGSVNQGVVHVPEGGAVTEAMMAYMQNSEQVDTMLAVGTLLNEDGTVRAAGGYLVQLLPEVGKGPLAIMTERLEDFRTIDHLLGPEFTPEGLRDELLYGMPFTNLDDSPVRYHCWCSEERLIAALATLDRKEIQSMIDDAEPLDITCDYCRRHYSILPNKLAGLLQPS